MLLIIMIEKNCDLTVPLLYIVKEYVEIGT